MALEYAILLTAHHFVTFVLFPNSLQRYRILSSNESREDGRNGASKSWLRDILPQKRIWYVRIMTFLKKKIGKDLSQKKWYTRGIPHGWNPPWFFFTGALVLADRSPPPPLEWISSPPLVSAVLITTKGDESPGSSRMGVIGALVIFSI